MHSRSILHSHMIIALVGLILLSPLISALDNVNPDIQVNTDLSKNPDENLPTEDDTLPYGSKTSTKRSATLTETSNNQEDSKLQDAYPISDDNKKLLIAQVKTNLLHVLGLKEEPKKPRNKAYVPQAMLEAYMRTRESVRDVIPDDRDFYGKINIDDLDSDDEEKFWASVRSKYGNYDIEVDMGNDDNDHHQYHYRGEASTITHVGTLEDPQLVPPNIEASLPPSTRYKPYKKSFISVHLKFNLSQEIFIKPSGPDDLRGAVLHLEREPLPSKDCESDTCDSSSPEIALPKIKSESNKINYRPRYQRIYIIQVMGYDKYGDPIVRTHDSRRIDTTQGQTLTFDIYGIVQSWLADPKSNYGIIVRVTNDDREIEQVYKTGERITITNTSLSIPVEEHVRLKRDFRSFTESEDTWIRRRPSLLIYTDSPDNSRKHVKREQSLHQTETHPRDTTASSSSSPERQPSPRAGSISGQSSRQRGTPRSSGQRASAASRSKSRTNKASGKCSRNRLKIDFKEVGWTSWIIAPLVYDANFCFGDCSFPLHDHQNASNHAILQSIFHSVGHLVPRSSCAPIKFGKMIIIYQLDGNILMGNYDDMIVEACGCQ